MQTILKNWNLVRIIRLVLGFGLLGYGYFITDWLLILIGIVLGFMAITNSGCNPFGGSCDVNYKKDIES